MDSPVSERGAIVEFRDVSKQYDANVVVEKFNLTVGAGEFLTLLGPSGSGKTTLLNMMAGFINPSAGEIRIDGRPITNIATEQRNIGMVFQNYSLFPHMTVEQNVAFPLKMRRVDAAEIRRKVGQALDLVGLSELARRKPAQLSGGQKQRIAFARAIVFNPKVLLMDEPLGALDLKLRERMQMEIVKYRKEVGCTVIYVTHDQGEALAMSDRIVVMDKGAAMQVGTPIAVYDQPRSIFVAKFVGEMNTFKLRQDAGGPLHIPGLEITLAPNLAVDGGLLCIRPEKLIRQDAPSSPPRKDFVEFDVTVVESVFAGNDLRILARSRLGEELLLKESRGGGDQRRTTETGQVVRIGFHLRDAVFLRD